MEVIPFSLLDDDKQNVFVPLAEKKLLSLFRRKAEETEKTENGLALKTVIQ